MIKRKKGWAKTNDNEDVSEPQNWTMKDEGESKYGSKDENISWCGAESRKTRNPQGLSGVQED